jgi:hypothetical protein
VYEQVAEMNETIIDLCVDPVKAYAEHRAIYEETGDLAQLRLALEYVQP